MCRRVGAGAVIRAPRRTGLTAHALGQVLVPQGQADFFLRRVQQVFERLNFAEDVKRAGEEVNGNPQVAFLHTGIEWARLSRRYRGRSYVDQFRRERLANARAGQRSTGTKIRSFRIVFQFF